MCKFHRTKAALFILFFFPLLGFSQQLAFPGAEGYGRFASGGRGNGQNGKVVVVTNLEDDLVNPPVGSFRWAVKQGTETKIDPIIGSYVVKLPLTVVFQVGGVIQLKGELRINRNNVTIAGQTAPGDGICFRGATLNFGDSHNVIVRYLRSRPGDELGLETSAFRIENGGNFIIDHCSFSWAIEETTHFSSSNNFTVQWCIISESFYNSFHKKGARGYGTQWGGSYASYHHNLLADHNSRMPRINGSNPNDVEALVDYRNNVNFNWGSKGAFYGGEWMKTNGKGFAHTNVVNNYFIPGPATTFDIYYARPSMGDNGYSKWYFNGNVMVGNGVMTADNWLGVDPEYVGSNANIRSDTEFAKTDGILEAYANYTESAIDAYHSVMKYVGAILPRRDTIDARVIAEAKGEIPIVRYQYVDSTGQVSPLKGLQSGLIDTQWNLVPSDAPAGTTPWDVYKTSSDAPLDSDLDGMPDAWETDHGLKSADITDGKLIAGNGYSNLENFLNSKDLVTSITQMSMEEKINFFPNPFSDLLQIDFGNQINKIELYNLSGTCVYREKNNSGISSVELSMLIRGIYLVKVTDFRNQIHIGKVIKQ